MRRNLRRHAEPDEPGIGAKTAGGGGKTLMSWKPLLLALKSIAVAAAVLALLGAGILWRVADAPLSLGFLSSRVVALLAVPHHGLRTETDDVLLSWSWWDRDLDIRVAGLRFLDRTGRQVARAEAAVAEVDAPAFARHWIGRLDLVRATRPSPDGAKDEAAPLPPGLERVPGIAGSAHDASPFLKRLTVRNASFGTGLPGISELRLERTASGFAGTFGLDTGPSRGTASWDVAAGSGDLALELDGLPLGRLAAALTDEPRLPDMALSGKVFLRYDGERRSVRLDLGEGEGTVAFPGAEPVAFSGLAASVRLDLAARRLSVEGTELSLGGTGIAVRNVEASFGESVAVSGSVEAERLPPALLDAAWPPRDGGGDRSRALAGLREAGPVAADVALRFDRGDGTVRFDVSSGPGRIAAPDGVSAPLRYDRLVLGGRYDRAAKRLALDDTALVLGGASLTLRSAEAVFGEDAAVRVRIETDAMPLAALATFWPPGAAPGAREWALANLRGGTVFRIAADLAARVGIGRGDLGEVEIETLSGEAEFEDVAVSRPRPPGPVRGADAVLSGKAFLRYDGERRSVRLDLGEGEGTVAFPGAEPVAFSGLAASGRLDLAARRLSVERTELSLGGTGIAVRNVEASFGESVAVSGSVEAERLPPALLDAAWPPRAGGGDRSRALAGLRDAGPVAADVALRFDRGDGTVRFDVSAGPGRIAAPDGVSAPLRYDRLVLGGRYDRAAKRLTLDDTALALGGASLTLRNAEAVFGEDAAVRVRIEADAMPLAALATFWPPGAAPGAREWALANLRDGTVSRIAADLAARVGIGRDDLGEVEIETLSGEAGLEGVAVSRPRPPGPVGGADAVLSGKAFLRYDGERRSVRLDLGEGKGTVAFPGAEPVAFSGLAASGRLDLAARRLSVERTELSLGGTGIAVRNVEASFGESVAVSGSVEAERLPPALLDAAWPPRAGGGDRSRALAGLRDAGPVAADVALRFDRGDGTVRFDVSAGPGRIAAPDGVSAPLRYDRLVLGGRYDRAAKRLALDDTVLALDRVRLTLRNAEAVFGEDAAVRVRVETDAMPLAALATFWPPGAAPGAREWALANLRDGTVSRIAADLAARVGIGRDDLGEVEIETLSGEAGLEGVTVSYLRPLGPVRGADATMTFGDGRVDFKVRSGRAGALGIRDGEIGIRGIGGERETLSVSVSVDGPTADALAILDHPRLDLLSRVSREHEPPVAPQTVGGTQTTRLDLGFPLLADLEIDDLDLSAVSNLSGLSLPRIFGNRSLKNGEFALEYGEGRMTASGTAEIADRPVRLLWRERFAGHRSTTVSGSLTLDGELADELAVGRFLDGPVEARLVYRRDGSAPATLVATLDIEDAALDVPAFDRIKEPHRPGTITLRFRPGGGGFGRLVEAALRTGDAAGRARRDDGTWQVDVDYGKTAFSGTVRRGGDGVHLIDIAGAGFDAARLIEKTKTEGTPVRRPVRLTGAFDSFWIKGERPLTDAKLVLDRTRDGWRQIRLDAALPGENGAIRTEMTAVPGGHDLFADIEDAGMFLAALGMSDAVRGEAATLRAERRGSVAEPWKGRVETGNVRVIRAPFLARLLQLLSPTGLLATLRNEGIEFREAVIPFEFQDGLTTISDAKVVGNDLSLTASGTLDVDESRLDLSGTVIPAPLLNSLLESIPVIGPLGAGGTNRGVFAANYQARGPVADPEVRVNPLSLLVPGLLRELFGNPQGSFEGDSEPDRPEDP